MVCDGQGLHWRFRYPKKTILLRQQHIWKDLWSKVKVKAERFWDSIPDITVMNMAEDAAKDVAEDVALSEAGNEAVTARGYQYPGKCCEISSMNSYTDQKWLILL